MLKSLVAKIGTFRSDRRGVTSLEYGVIAAVTIVSISTVLAGIGPKLSTIWTGISGALGAG